MNIVLWLTIGGVTFDYVPTLPAGTLTADARAASQNNAMGAPPAGAARSYPGSPPP